MRAEGITFFEGMRLLAGVGSADTTSPLATEQAKTCGLALSPANGLPKPCTNSRRPAAGAVPLPGLLCVQLRPYQQIGVHWLKFMTRLGLGACLADDMGLGKTIQVLGLLLHLSESGRRSTAPPTPSVSPPVCWWSRHR